MGEAIATNTQSDTPYPPNKSLRNPITKGPAAEEATRIVATTP